MYSAQSERPRKTRRRNRRRPLHRVSTALPPLSFLRPVCQQSSSESLRVFTPWWGRLLRDVASSSGIGAQPIGAVNPAVPGDDAGPACAMACSHREPTSVADDGPRSSRGYRRMRFAVQWAKTPRCKFNPAVRSKPVSPPDARSEVVGCTSMYTASPRGFRTDHSWSAPSNCPRISSDGPRAFPGVAFLHDLVPLLRAGVPHPYGLTIHKPLMSAFILDRLQFRVPPCPTVLGVTGEQQGEDAPVHGVRETTDGRGAAPVGNSVQGPAWCCVGRTIPRPR
jgi:hypothetical protein